MQGFLKASVSVLLQVGKRTNVADMENDSFYKFIQKTYPLHPLAAAVALFAWGGLPYLVWGMVRPHGWDGVFLGSVVWSHDVNLDKSPGRTGFYKFIGNWAYRKCSFDSWFELGLLSVF